LTDFMNRTQQSTQPHFERPTVGVSSLVVGRLLEGVREGGKQGFGV
jgi:hypothetical protein